MTGVVAWFTGLPASGKSTLARAVARRLEAGGGRAVRLDGDEVRAALVPAPGYDEAGREAFYETLAKLAVLLAGQGHVVLVAATANRRRHRQRAREGAPAFVEVLVDVPVEEAARRDPKGLYRAAREGRIRGLPGVDAVYERPEAPEVVARGGRDEAAVEAVLAALRLAGPSSRRES